MWNVPDLDPISFQNSIMCSCSRSGVSSSTLFLCGVIVGTVLTIAINYFTDHLKAGFAYVTRQGRITFQYILSSKNEIGRNHSSYSFRDNSDQNRNLEGNQILEESIKLFAEQTKCIVDNSWTSSKVVNYLSPEKMISKLFSLKDENASLRLSRSGEKDLTNNNGHIHTKRIHKREKAKDIIECFRNIQKYSVNTNHPFFFNQLFGALDPVSLAAELIALSVNTSVYTWETAPVFTLIEREVIQKVGSLIFERVGEDDDNTHYANYGNKRYMMTDNGYRNYDGLMLPGGALSNLTALHVARHFMRENIALHCQNRNKEYNKPQRLSTRISVQEEKKENQGMTRLMKESTSSCLPFESPYNPELIAFVSVEAHYSFTKAVSVTGIGLKNLVLVPTTPNGQMDTTQLDLLMTQSSNYSRFRIPFFVAATSGSTVRGSFDNIEAIVKVCRKHEDRINAHIETSRQHNIETLKHKKLKIWIHVDGAWGGSAIFSNRSDISNSMKGLRHVDSFTFNPHKLLGAPQQTTVFVSRYEGILKSANSSGAKYLFDPRKNGAKYDLGDGSYTCGRRTDAIKFWALWKFHGVDGLGKLMEDKVDTLQYLVKCVKKRRNFLLACTPWLFNVNFYFIPNRIRKKIVKHLNEVDDSCSRFQSDFFESDNPKIPDYISEELAAISVKLKLRLHRSGEMIIPYQPLENQKADCFRIVLAGYKKFNEDDVERVLDLMEQYGYDL